MGPLHTSLSLPAPLAVGISPLSAQVLAFLFTTSYVGSIYLSQTFLPHGLKAPQTKNSKVPAVPPVSATDVDGTLDPDAPAPGSRDHPDVIRLRMRAVRTATSLSTLGVWYTVKTVGLYGPVEALWPTLRLLGIPATLSTPTLASALPYALAPTLLLGPIYATYLDGDLPFQGGLVNRLKSIWQDFGLVETRNYVVAPITEELVFRSTIIAASLLGGFSARSITFGTPLWFGLAHVHHANEQWRKGGKTRAAAVQALGTSLFQLTYTTLFGWFASYLFIRTGSIVPPIASHIFCNVMGIYLPGTAAARHPRRKISIWIAYLAGVAGFVYGLRQL